MAPFAQDEWIGILHPTAGAGVVTLPESRWSSDFLPDEEALTETARYRVLHFINGEHYSGAERVQDLLALHLPELGFDVGFACFKPNRFPQMRRSQDAPLHAVPMTSRLDLRGVLRVCRIICDEGYQILHAHTPRTLMVARLASMLTGRPVVYHVHSPTARDSTRRWQNCFNTLSERICLTRDVRLIAVSGSLGRYMQTLGHDSERVNVVPNGVPRVAVAERESPREEWTLGTVALFRPRKGTEVLLDALANLRHAGFSVRLRAVGPFETTDYENQLKERVRQLGLENAVDWIGFTRDVNSELAKFDLFVLPSLFGEGLPMVVLEAMAAGVPVVGAKVEGVPEAIRDRVDGTLAAPGDPVDLAHAIQSIITGECDWSELRTNALERHAERFSEISMARGVAAVYRNMLKENGFIAS